MTKILDERYKQIVDEELLNIFNTLSTSINAKANSSDVYTKLETDEQIRLKVAEIVAGAPSDFDTLKEMSDWLNTHADSAAAMNVQIQDNASDIATLQSEIQSQSTTIGTHENKINALTNNVSSLSTGLSAATQNISNAQADIDNNSDDISALKERVAYNKTTLGYQIKNLFDVFSVNWAQPSKTTVSEDGTVTATVTSDPREFTYSNSDAFVTLGAGTYKVIVNTTNFVSGTYAQINAYNKTNNSVFSLAMSSKGIHKTTFTLTERTTVGMVIKAYSQTFTVMICDAGFEDESYVPYTQPNVDTRIADNTNDIAINKTTLGYQKKNLLKNRGTSQIINGVTFTINEDKTVTANGTATDNATLHLSDSVKLNVGTKYILSGCPEGGGLSTYRLYGLSNGYGWYDNGSDEGESKQFTATESESYTYRICVYKGTTVNNLVFKPMIRLADITDDTYEPYVESVDERLQTIESTQLIDNPTVTLEYDFTTATSTIVNNPWSYDITHMFVYVEVRTSDDAGNYAEMLLTSNTIVRVPDNDHIYVELPPDNSHGACLFLRYDKTANTIQVYGTDADTEDDMKAANRKFQVKITPLAIPPI